MQTKKKRKLKELVFDAHLGCWVYLEVPDDATYVDKRPLILRKSIKNGFYPYDYNFLFQRREYIISCSYCGRFMSARDITRDHTYPKSRGGLQTTPSCLRCNELKADSLPIAWAIRYSRVIDVNGSMSVFQIESAGSNPVWRTNSRKSKRSLKRLEQMVQAVNLLAEHVTLFSSMARTVDENSKDIHNDEGATGLVVVIDCTAIDASPSVVFTIQGKDWTSGKYYTILQSAAIVGTGTTVLRVHPDLTAAANTIAKDMLPAYWRVVADHSDTDSITYSVGASMV